MILPRTGTSEVALLGGILRCAKCDAAMNVTYGRKRKNKTAPHYYVCNMKTMSQQAKCQNKNANGMDIDTAVIKCITDMSSSKNNLLNELEALRKADKSSVSASDLDELKKHRNSILDEIDNLVGEISKSKAASKYIIPQIEARDKELEELDKKILRLEKEKEEKRKDLEDFDLVISSILNFSKAIKQLSNKEKKHFLQTIVDKAYWDGEAGTVEIKLLTDKKN